MKAGSHGNTSGPPNPPQRGGAPALTCAGLLHPPVWEELTPAGLGRGGAPFDHPHVIVHGRLGQGRERRAVLSLGFQT